jgi:hypothetical protein
VGRNSTRFPSYYISNKGRVFSTTTFVWCYSQPNKKYYHKITLFRGKEKFSTHIHTLVGKHFLPEWEEGLFVLHHKETLPYPEINYPSNLWVGNSEDNNRDRCIKGRSGGFLTGRVCMGVLQTGGKVL